MKNISALILAAGEGTRLNSGAPSVKPKVLYEVAGKPMLFYSLDVLKELGVEDKVLVVGHLAEEIKKVVGAGYKFASQEGATGTGEAVRIGLSQINPSAEQVLVLYGADIYQKQTLQELIAKHLIEKPTISFLTAERENPTGLGRIIRDESGNLKAIVEEKVATETEKKIKEVNDGCYLFEKSWLEEAIKKLKLTKINEYFLTDLIELAALEQKRIVPFKIETGGWFGVDTPDQLRLTNEFVKKNWTEK